jgi:glycosyltransferase involved in cell wall biosynthesis
MRILTVSNCPLDRSLGSGYVISGYADRLRSLGHEVTALQPADYEWLPRLPAAKRLRMLLGYSAAVSRAVGREHFDIVELWGAESWRSVRRLARMRRRPLLVGRSNGLEPHFREALAGAGGFRTGIAGSLFDRWQEIEAAFREVDLLTTVSQFDHRYALDHGYQPEGRLLALENPLDDEWLDRPLQAERPPVIGYFGGWLARKGCDLVASILPPVLRAHPGWRARLVGVGPLRPADFLPLDVAARVEVLPFVSDRVALRALYDRTSVVLMPSVYESFSLAAAEAMACGCALVASPTGIAADLRPNDEAVIVKERSAGAWCAAVGALLGDEVRRLRIARRGGSRVQSLRWSEAVSRLLAFYQSHLSKNGNVA